LKAIQTIALGVLGLGLVMPTGSQARDWSWYPPNEGRGRDALRPEFEGARPDGPDGNGLTEIEEMRLWLQRRDEDRRRQGITVPDVEEQLEPAGDITVRRRHQWPEPRLPSIGAGRDLEDDMTDGSALDEQSERVRETLFPNSYRQHHGQAARWHGRSRHFTSSQRFWRHGAKGSAKSHGGARRKRR
jgi:hypothetical protein